VYDARPQTKTVQSGYRLPKNLKKNTEVVSETADEDEEELEIPAFIRKKMNEKK